MKKFLKYLPHFLITALVVSFVGIGIYNYQVPKASAACGTGYSFCRQVSVDHTQAGASDSSSFTVLASTTLTSLKTVANGGDVNNTVTFNGQTVPADLVFSTTSDCGTLMSWDFENYTATTGEIEAWVLVSTLSHTSDTIFYICYGKASVTTYQGGSIGAAYDGSTAYVQHFPNGSTLTENDSSSGGNNSTTVNAAATTGNIDGAASYSGSIMDTFPSVALSSFPYNNTVSAWVNINPSVSGTVFEPIVSDNGGNTYVLYVVYTGSVFHLYGFNSNTSHQGSTVLSASTWHYIVFTNSGSTGTNTATLYIDGVPDSGGTFLPGAMSSLVHFGGDTSNEHFKGNIDEVKLSNIARSQDWITAEYNNQKSGSTMVTFGSEQSGGGVVAVHAKIFINQAKAIIIGKVIIQ